MMKALMLSEICQLPDNPEPLKLVEIPFPKPAPDELLVKISACGVCHTELDEIEGRTAPPELPVIPGHQAVGRVVQTGDKVNKFKIGDRVGVAWIYSSCRRCEYCLAGLENLCPDFKATGRDKNGGYAEYMTIGQDFAFKIPEFFTDSEAAPLLCAGAIGYRSLRLCNLENGQNLGLTGFGASAHLVLKLAKFIYPETKIFVFARSQTERDFALSLGAVWAGETMDKAPEKLLSIIDTTPVWMPVVEALTNLAPGGRLVINAIRKEDSDKGELTKINYPEHLWLEKEIKSVANVAPRDVREFLDFAAEMKIKPEYTEYTLEDANKALLELKEGKIRGAKVLRV